MALLNRTDLIGRYNKRQLNLYDESVEKNYSKSSLKAAAECFSSIERYDIFLSHSFDDARVVKVIKELLEEKGFKVYVDWIEDEHLDRG